MLKNRLFHGYMAEEGGEGGAAGGISADPAKTELDPPPAGKVSDKEAELVKEVMSKKKVIGELQSTITRLQDDLKRFDGIDPDAVKTMLEKQKQEQEQELERKGEYDRLKAQMIENHKREIGELNERISSIQSTLESALNQNAELTVGNAFSGSVFIKDETVLTAAQTRKLYGDHFAYVDGQVVGYDKPAGSSERTILVDSVGNPLPFDEALKKVIESDPEKDTILRSKAKRGAASGTLPNTKPFNPPKKLSSAEKIAVGLRKMSEGKLK